MQARPDRDMYVKVDPENVRGGASGDLARSNFGKEMNASVRHVYDMMSLMHYGGSAFAKPPLRTIEPLPAGYAKYSTDKKEYPKFAIGQRVGLTQTDADRLAEMYSRVSVGGCVASRLTVVKECADRPESERYTYGLGCSGLVEKLGAKACRHTDYAYYFCCKCGGGFRLQTWASAAPSPPPPPPPPPSPPPPSPPPPPPPSPPPGNGGSFVGEYTLVRHNNNSHLLQRPPPPTHKHSRTRISAQARSYGKYGPARGCDEQMDSFCNARQRKVGDTHPVILRTNELRHNATATLTNATGGRLPRVHKGELPRPLRLRQGLGRDQAVAMLRA